MVTDYNWQPGIKVKNLKRENEKIRLPPRAMKWNHGYVSGKKEPPPVFEKNEFDLRSILGRKPNHILNLWNTYWR